MLKRPQESPIGPWYREPWPWILISLPAAAVLAGVVTLWLAIKSDDGLVASDYYRRGLAINQTLSRQQHAERLQYAARVTFSADGRSVRVKLTGAGTLPAAVQLRLAHPTRAELDQVLVMAGEAGDFAAVIGVPVTGRRRVVLQDAANSWQLTGEAPEAAGATVALTAGRG
jgi:uncharacterized protein